MNELTKQLEQIVPGKTYPYSVYIQEVINGKVIKIKFLLQSYVVGMYCAIHVEDSTQSFQTGHQNQKSFTAKLKKDIVKAITRGATVEIGPIQNVKTI